MSDIDFSKTGLDIPSKWLLTSVDEPIGSASGNVMRLGTKNTGNHLASTAAPGANCPYNVFPKGARRKVAKSAPQPLREAGNEIAYLMKRARKASLMAKKLTMATIAFGFRSGFAPSIALVAASRRVVLEYNIWLLLTLLLADVDQIGCWLLTAPVWNRAFVTLLIGTNAAADESRRHCAMRLIPFLITAGEEEP